MRRTNTTIHNKYPIIRGLLLFVILLLLANKMDANVDSLQQLWTNVDQPDSTRYDAIIEYYNQKIFSHPDSVILMSAYHIELAQQKNSPEQMAIAMGRKAIALSIKGDSDNGLIEMKKVVDIYSNLGDSFRLTRTYNNLAIIYFKQLEYQEGLKYYLKSLTFYQKNKKYEKFEARTLLDIGEIYLEIGNYDLALDYFNSSLSICEKLELENPKGIVLTKIGYVKLKNKKYREAIRDSKKALKIFQPINQKYYIADNYTLQACIYLELSQMDTAMMYIEKALELHQAIGNNSVILQDQIILANIIFPNDVNKATQIGEEVLSEAGDYRDHLMKMELYNLLYKCYKKKKNYPRSIAMLEKHNAYADSLLIEQDQLAITKKVIQDKYEAQILGTQIESEKAQSRLRRNQLIKVFIISLLGAFTVLYIVFNARSKRIIHNKEKEGLEHKINHLKEMEHSRNQLIQSDKMASLGQLTAGVAHEINNPVNFISSGVIGLKKTLDEYIKTPKEEVGDELLEDMNNMIVAIEEGAKRTSNIVKSLRLFSREDTEIYIEVDLIKSLESTFTLLSNKIGNGVILEKDFDKKEILVYCFPGQLNQVFMNILSNAIQAIEGKGTVKVEVKEVAENIVVTISDNGPGIPDANKQKIFEPFYTTKDLQEGTGLGLSISFGIIKKHKGSIEVIDNDPKGTKFIINLPKRANHLINSIV